MPVIMLIPVFNSALQPWLKEQGTEHRLQRAEGSSRASEADTRSAPGEGWGLEGSSSRLHTPTFLC